ncbi:hypothetical protein, partial [Poseidonocella sp. HB161398]|uniref:hypothetical protein n=1 Tax=Poseidonocella sp. HB161398 TaxID=2320855 RepID=UPI00197F574D
TCRTSFRLRPVWRMICRSGHASIGELPDHLVGLLAPQKALVLQFSRLGARWNLAATSSVGARHHALARRRSGRSSATSPV